MKKLLISILCVAVGLAFSLSAAQAKEGKVNAGKKLLKPAIKLAKPFAKKAKKGKKGKKGTKGKKASKKTKLFDKLETGKSKNQKYRNAYLLAVLSKLAYQPKSKSGYRDTTSYKVKKKKRGKVKVGGKVNPKRFKEFGLELCNPEMPYWTTKKNKAGEKVIDAQAYLVHNDTTVVLTFRGTKEDADWATNKDAAVHYKLKGYGKNVKVHRGWLDATELAHKQFKLNKEIKKCLKKGGKDRKLMVTGHSLGGAMASLWSYYFRKKKKVQASRLYTYGAPSSGNKGYKKTFKKLTGKKFKAYTWVNQDDPVTGITWSLGFRRIGTPQWITCTGIGQLCKEKDLVLKTKMGARMAGPTHMHDMSTYMDRILMLSPKKVRKQLKKLGAGASVNVMTRCAYEGKCPKK